MNVLTSPMMESLLLYLFVGGCLLAIYGVVVTIALLDKPKGWICHARGMTLIGLFVMSAVGLCCVLFAGLRPEIASSIYTALTGLLVFLYARQLQIRAKRLRGLRGKGSLGEATR